MNRAIISVLMPVYNGEKYLIEAIDSILIQTFTDFEFIILNDGSTDRTEEIILSYNDERIRYVKNESNLQIGKSLNKGITLAIGKYIARMDADDVALPHRLATQFEYMNSNPDVIVCGSYVQIYEQPKIIWRTPIKDEAIKARLLFESCLFHPTVIFKTDMIIDSQEVYDPLFSGAEDYELWQRLSVSPYIHFANIPEVLLVHRIHPNDDRTHYKAKQWKLANLVRHNQLKQLGIGLNQQEISLHEALLYCDVSSFQLADLKRYHKWFEKIELANNQVAIYSPFYLNRELEYRWLRLCLHAAFQEPLVGFKFLLGKWSPNNFKSIYHMCRMLWRSRKSMYKSN